MADLALARSRAVDEIREGLLGRPPSLAPKFFYDRAGSALFDRITRLPDYYLTEAEISILRERGRDLADWFGPRAVLAEIAAGSARKARIVLGSLEAPAAWVPVDISEETLLRQAAEVRRARPDLEVIPVAADLSREFLFPGLDFAFGRFVVLYAGSSIGNLEPDAASELLARIGRAAGPRSFLLLGVDRRKDPRIIERAYNDAGGLNAAFNRNILNNVNALARGDFVPDRWDHRAFWNEARGRIELHLVSAGEQTVRVAGETLRFRRGDSIHTENSYKYTEEEVCDILGDAWRVQESWSDAREWFTVFLCFR